MTNKEIPGSLLIIDDTPENIQILIDILDKEHHIIHTITDPKDAYQAALNHLPDLILLDILMPDMNGFEVCEILKSDKITQDIPIIFLTACDEPTDVVKGFEAGSVDYIIKPFRIEEVRARIHTHLTLARTKRDLKTANSDLTATKDAMRQANNKLNLLATVTRHDILNQLTVIIGALDIMRQEITDPVFAHMMDHEWQAADTIRSLINFTRVYQDIGIKEPLWFEMQPLIEKAVGAFRLRDLLLTCDLNGLMIYGDPLLEKVFYNLVDNSIRHGGKVNAIMLTGIEREDGYNLVYADNGIGILDEDKSKIFRKGFGKNTGMGLFLIREILSITHIDIDERGEPGKGVRFEILIPKGSYKFE